MPVRIEYKSSVAKDLRRLSKKDAARILGKIERTLRSEGKRGVALRGEFKGLLRLRVGDHRVIYTSTPEGYLVLTIGHRRDVYGE